MAKRIWAKRKLFSVNQSSNSRSYNYQINAQPTNQPMHVSW